MQDVGENETEVTEFILIGWSGQPKSRMSLLIFLTVAYSIIVVGNGFIILVVIFEPRLHYPMYFFLCNLSIVDLCGTTTGIPQSIVNCLVDQPVMSFALCYVQMYAGVFFGETECLLLAVMAYDRYVAISNPLRYTLIMNKTVCIILGAVPWITSFIVIAASHLGKLVRFCGNNEVDHIACEFTAVYKLVCTDNFWSQISISLTNFFLVVIPLGFILFSYLRILIFILRIHSEKGRVKAFSTCGSHLAVVTLYFGPAIFSYLLPHSKNMHESDKILSIFYGVLTPLCNPLIYTLRNQEVLGALKQLFGKKG